ncbi:vang-like protein 1 isoform X2 [Ascaphus truei]|uniref:vang-like protein 1 isoform X2 n=1 Tax=Ascaphus truei TaxID=8439 RepID=UPI003F5A8005
MDIECNLLGCSHHSGQEHNRDHGCDGHKSVTIHSSPTAPLLGEDSVRGEERGQDDNWCGTTTAVTSERSVSAEDLAQSGTVREQSPGPDVRSMLGFCTCCSLVSLALLTPPAFILLPQVLWGSELEPCGVICEGLYISVAFKLLLLLLGSWAVFLRPPRCALPRLLEFRALLLLLLFVFLASYWLFYGVRVLGPREKNLRGVVQYAASLVDALLFIHYLSVVLLELRQLHPCFSLKVVRTCDGEARFYSLGTLSIQRAALVVLENYQKDFPVFYPAPPAADGLHREKQHTGVKVYSVSGPEDSTASQSHALILAGSAHQGSNYKQRYYEEAEHARKVRRRRARLVVAVHDAFSQLQGSGGQLPALHVQDPREAAQSIFPLIAQSLQRYLHTTRQAPHHSMEAILQQLTLCLRHGMAPQAFLEQYLRPGPPVQYTMAPAWLWSLVSEEPVTRPLRSGLGFCLQASNTRLVVSVSGIPILRLSEAFIPPNSHHFLLRKRPETNL